MRLDVRDLSYSFGDKKVLKEITLDVSPGEFIGLMGPNGSGKTTLLRCIMNFLSPPADSVSVNGEATQTLSSESLARMFAVVPQSSSTDFTFSAYDIVMMGRLPHRKNRFAGPTKADADAVRSAMERTGTWEFAGRPFSALSGGERQRVIIARAVAQQPQALLLDEPTVYLDINGQLEIMDLIRSLNKEEGITVISVLHDVNMAARYCDRIALLSDGWLEALGPPSSVLNPEVIQSVYGVEVVVRRDPFTNAVYVMPHSTVAAAPRHGRRVHVLCGGGVGGPIMKALLDAGYGVSSGVLNVLDSDFENARDLHIPTVTEAPFAAVSDAAYEKNLGMMSECEAVVVSPFPVGPGNLKNMEAASVAVSRGKRVVAILPDAGRPVDFVDGKADAIMRELISSGAIPVMGIAEMLRELRRGEGR
ncbi:MAG: ABC transporter ATP-binding protein [Candidatus Thermoplasmatota archaeon]|nr:ABC transporter ATP-binding protein [Candidatus Thermoplasmatota archaeon]